jgi:hypothetical protein
MMRDYDRLCLGRRQFEQAQAPPQPQPPESAALAVSPLPITANVENMALVLVPSHLGQTCRSSRLA